MATAHQVDCGDVRARSSHLMLRVAHIYFCSLTNIRYCRQLANRNNRAHACIREHAAACRGMPRRLQHG